MSVERRLLRDLKELVSNPLLHVVAAPLEDVIYEWHGNCSCPPFDQVVFHFVLKFPPNYPVSPPKLTLSTPVPHKNVFVKAGHGGYELCLDMLANDSFMTEAHKEKSYAGWSTTYSVYSILLQLQGRELVILTLTIEAFLLDPDFLEETANKPSVTACISEAKHFKCRECGHCSSSPHPTFPTPEDLEKAQKQKIEVVRPMLCVRRDHPKVVKKATFTTTPFVTSTKQSPVVTTTTTSTVLGLSSTNQDSSPIVRKTKTTDTWCEWKGRVARFPQEPKTVQKVSSTSTPTNIYAYLSDLPSTPVVPYGEKYVRKSNAQGPSVSHPKTPVGKFGNTHPGNQCSKLDHLKIIQQQQQQQQQKEGGLNNRKKQGTAGSNSFIQHQLNAQQKKQSPPKKLVAPTIVPAPLVSAPTVASIASPAKIVVAKPTKAEFVDPKTKHPSTLDSALKSLNATKVPKVTKIELGEPWMGAPLLNLPFEIVHSIVMLTDDIHSVSSLSMVCRYLYQVVEDGFLWKQLFSKYYPLSQFTATNLNDWKYLFHLEVGRIFDTLRCYHTKLNFEEDVLGIPLEVTINPKLEEIDYIYTTLDFLSSEAFLHEKVRKTVWKEDFRYWLPLYITHDHFQRALPLIEKTMVQLSHHWGVQKFSPYMVAEVIPKMMNTMVVLLSDKGVHTSEKALSGFCALHRLFIALVKQYPQLQTYIDKEVAAFCSDPEKRHKNETPNLGNFIPLLSVSTLPWKKVLPLVLSEMLDRNFIWVAKKYQGLSSVQQHNPTTPDFDRLTKTFDASSVSLRLLMFHVQFLKRFRRISDLDAIAFDYDRYYGFPSYRDLTGFQKSVAKVLQVTGWNNFYNVCDLKTPSPLEMTKILLGALKNSRKKKYHTDKTDFSKIHASGVSKILLKGDSYTCNSNLQSVTLEEIWRYPEGKRRYLDASCLAFNFGEKKACCFVDYSHTSAFGAITHSGDVLDTEKNQGKHIINVSLKKLPPTVERLYFTITAFHCQLKDILFPSILFLDPDSKQELCSYQFGDNKNTDSKTAVIMAKMTRKHAGSPWEVQALGHLGMGMAGNYNPIVEDIESLNL